MQINEPIMTNYLLMDQPGVYCSNKSYEWKHVCIEGQRPTLTAVSISHESRQAGADVGRSSGVAAASAFRDVTVMSANATRVHGNAAPLQHSTPDSLTDADTFEYHIQSEYPCRNDTSQKRSFKYLNLISHRQTFDEAYSFFDV